MVPILRYWSGITVKINGCVKLQVNRKLELGETMSKKKLALNELHKVKTQLHDEKSAVFSNDMKSKGN